MPQIPSKFYEWRHSDSRSEIFDLEIVSFGEIKARHQAHRRVFIFSASFFSVQIVEMKEVRI